SAAPPDVYREIQPPRTNVPSRHSTRGRVDREDHGSSTPPSAPPSPSSADPASAISRVPLQWGCPEQPQNCPPAFFPRRAVRSSIGRPHSGQSGAPFDMPQTSKTFITSSP